MKQHALYVHIGTPKTGTKALQGFLYKNNSRLLQYGYVYPDLKIKLNGIKAYRAADYEKNGDVLFSLCSYPIVRPIKIDTAAKNWIVACHLIHKELEQNNVIISAEEFSFSYKSLFEELAKEFENVFIVVYLRRQDELIESFWNQQVKGGYFSGTFHEFLDTELSSLEWLHYDKVLQYAENIFGFEKLIIRIYEKTQLYGQTIESDFLYALGIDSDCSAWEKGCFPNYGLNGDFLQIKNIFNSVNKITGIPASRREFMDYFAALSNAFDEYKIYTCFSSVADRKKFLNNFSLENEHISRKFLKRESGKLFSDVNKNQELSSFKNNTEINLENVIRTFSFIVCQMNDRLREVEIWKMYSFRKQLKTLCMERELLLFAAGGDCENFLKLWYRYGISLDIKAIVDNDLDKRGKFLFGYEIWHVSDITDWNQYFFVITRTESIEIEKQLENIGLKKNYNFITTKFFFR